MKLGIGRTLCGIFIALLILNTSAAAQTNYWTTITASKIMDAGGHKLAKGKITAQFVTLSGADIPVNPGDGGTTISTPAFAVIVNGAITTTLQVPDTTHTNPLNACLKLVISEASTGKPVRTFSCVQPSGATWSLDSYAPSLAPLVVQQTGPQGPPGIGADANCHTDGSGKLTCSSVAVGTTVQLVLTCDGTTDNLAKINSALSTASDVRVSASGSGSCMISAPIALASVNNKTLSFDPKMVLAPTSGFGANPMISVTGTASDIKIQGGRWNANSIAQNCSLIQSGAGVGPQRVWVERTECYGSTSHGIFVGSADSSSYFLAQDVHINDNYVHNLGLHGITIGTARRVEIVGNRIDSPVVNTGAGIHLNANGAIVQRNAITGFSGTGFEPRGISAYGLANFDISGNQIIGDSSISQSAGSDIHLDTVFNGSISNNSVQSGYYGLVCEVCQHVAITGNSVRESRAAVGLYVEGRGDSVQNDALDATTNLSAGAGVSLGIDSGDKQEGAASVTLAASSATGKLVSHNFSPAADWSLYSNVSLWVKSDTAINRGVLQLHLSCNANLATPHTTMALPALQAGVWTQLDLLNPEFFRNYLCVGSWGIVSTQSLTVNLKIDDLRMLVKSKDVTVSGNTVYRTGQWGIRVGNDGTDIAVLGNTVVDPGWMASTTPSATVGVEVYALGSGAEVKRVVVANNTAYTAVGLAPSMTGIHVSSDGVGVASDIRALNNVLLGNWTIPVNFINYAVSNYMDSGNMSSSTSTYNFNSGGIYAGGASGFGGPVTITPATDTTPQAILADHTDQAARTLLMTSSGGGTATLFDIDPQTSTVDKTTTVRICRNVNATSCILQIMPGDNTATANIVLNGKTGKVTANGGFAVGSTTVVDTGGNVDVTHIANLKDTFRAYVHGYGAVAYGTGTANLGKTVLDKAITVTRVNIAGSQTVTCTTTYPTIRVTDGSTNIDLTLSNGTTWDSGAITTNIAAGATLSLGVQTAGSGCGSGNLVVNVQYRMQ